MIIQKCRQVNRFFPPPKKFTFFSPAFTCRHAGALTGPRHTGGRTFHPRSPAATRGFDGAAPHGRPNFLPAFTCDTQGALPGPRRTGGRTFCPHSPAVARAYLCPRRLTLCGHFVGAAPHGRPNFSPAFTVGLCRGRAARAAELFTRVHPPTRGHIYARGG